MSKKKVDEPTQDELEAANAALSNFRAAVEAKDALWRKSQPPTAHELALAEQAVHEAMMDVPVKNDWDATAEPVMHQLAGLAQRRNPVAMRLLLDGTQRVRFYKPAPTERQLPDIQWGLNGIAMTIPRGETVTLPVTVANLLAQSGIQ